MDTKRSKFYASFFVISLDETTSQPYKSHWSCWKKNLKGLSDMWHRFAFHRVKLTMTFGNTRVPRRDCAQAPQAQNTWCMRQLVYIENCTGKSPIIKKKCVNNYLIWNKVFLPQLCRELISCDDFKAILTPFTFSGVIWNRYSSF